MMMMMSPTPTAMNELSMRLRESNRAYNTDGLVPTTVTEQTADYEEPGFYQLESKEATPDMSGTSTPYSEGAMAMEMFAKYAESWRDDLPAMAPFNTQETTVTVLYSADNSNTDSEDSEEELEGDEGRPEILRRSVKGMTVEEKKLRRRELNRLAAQRSRQKKRTSAATLEQEAKRLTKRNAELRVELSLLESAKTELYGLIKNHFKKCSTDTKNNNNNNFNNNNPNPKAAAPSADVVSVKLEIPATACRATEAPAATHHATGDSYGDISDMYQGYSAGISGMSEDYFVAYD